MCQQGGSSTRPYYLYFRFLFASLHRLLYLPSGQESPYTDLLFSDLGGGEVGGCEVLARVTVFVQPLLFLSTTLRRAALHSVLTHVQQQK